MGISLIFASILVCCCTLFLPVRAEPVEDKRALLDFIDNIHHTRKLNWDEKIPACNSWTGITCDHNNSRVVAIRLPAVGFRGIIPSNTLTRLAGLQILSLRSNGLSGPFPSDLLRLDSLMAVYLEDNNFQGPLPLDFSDWKNLSVLNLSNNGFNGTVPSSFTNLTLLTVLSLANNSFSGEIPNIDIPSLQLLDLSNNNLTGVLPKSLSRFPGSSFSGNNILTENSLPPVSPPSPAPINRSRITKSAILAIVIGSCAIAFVSIALLLIATNRKKKDEDPLANEKKENPKKNKIMVSGNQDKNTRLVFFEGCRLAFDLEDLLRASAEVLGKGTFGTTYKAALEDSTTVAVKRLREVVVGRKEFEMQMEIVGSVRHENVAPLRAYYYSKEEKLMVYDYYDWGSLSGLLHAKRGDKRVHLDWETRLNIAIGAARGLAHIHSQSGGKLVHGNIKSSNIFLNSQHQGCVSDLGLATLINPIAPPVMRAVGYRAPEVTDTRKVSQPADVYSFGVVLLELLTGKSPVKTGGGTEEVVHLVRWVHSVVREEWTGEVFDVELLRYQNIEEEMVTMLQVGMGCVARVAEQRPRIRDVMRVLEEIRGVGTSNNSQSGGMMSPGSTPGLTPRVVEIGSSSVS